MQDFEVLTPGWHDTRHQGFALPPVNVGAVGIAYSLAKLVQAIFLRHEGEVVEILPALPAEFVSGRYCAVNLPGVGTFDLEWSKRLIRRFIFTPEESASLTFCFPKNAGRMRLRLNDKEKGITLRSGSTFAFEGGKRYFFDRFQKSGTCTHTISRSTIRTLY